jgi:hypothetical protein
MRIRAMSVLFALVVVGICRLGSAQEVAAPPADGNKPFVVGAYMSFGMSHSIIKSDHLDSNEIMDANTGIDQKPKPRFAGGGGAYFDFYVLPILAVEGGIGFLGKGFRLKDDDVRYWNRVIYMEIPLGAKLNIKNFQAALAIDLFFALSGKTKAKSDNDEASHSWNDDDWDNFKRFNIGPKLTLGYAIPLGPVSLVPGLSWSMDLINNLKGDADADNCRDRNWNLMFNVGGEFGFGG